MSTGNMTVSNNTNGNWLMAQGGGSGLNNIVYSMPSVRWDGGVMTIDDQDRGSRDDNAVLIAMKDVKSSAKLGVVRDSKKVEEQKTLLKSLGFSNLSKAIEELADKSMKENLATLAGYKKITYAKFQEANSKLRSLTQSYKMLSLTPIATYLGQHYSEGDVIDDEKISLPPVSALNKLAEAKKQGVFDDFAVIHVVRGPDPILVGTIKGTRDMFMIDEWGDDISFNEIMN